MRACCGLSDTTRSKRKLPDTAEDNDDDDEGETLLQKALSAYTSRSSESPNLSNLYLARICRTAGHELGHCFGMDHCVYYACSMQGSASLPEDSRQPPYLCPVDLAKLLTTTGGNEKERYLALFRFCERFRDEGFWAAYGRWIEVKLDR